MLGLTKRNKFNCDNSRAYMKYFRRQAGSRAYSRDEFPSTYCIQCILLRHITRIQNNLLRLYTVYTVPSYTCPEICDDEAIAFYELLNIDQIVLHLYFY